MCFKQAFSFLCYDFELLILLPTPPESGDYRVIPPCPIFISNTGD